MAQITNGVLAAPALSIAPCGLLSVADVVRHESNDEQWIRGFLSESTASPTVNLRTINNDVVTNGNLYDGSAIARYYSVHPFLAELVDKRTGKDLESDNPRDGLIEDQMDAVTQKVAELEFWEGRAAQALTPTPATGYLRQQTGGATVVTSGGLAPNAALARLEQGITNSPTGTRGIIHMTRDVATELGTSIELINPSKDSTASTFAVTRLGTLVVIGTGYTGNGPIGATGATATATNKWMFATSNVIVEIGATDLVTQKVADGFDPAKNDSVTVAQRPVAVHFDPSIWVAAQVTLT